MFYKLFIGSRVNIIVNEETKPTLCMSAKLTFVCVTRRDFVNHIYQIKVSCLPLQLFNYFCNF